MGSVSAADVRELGEMDLPRLMQIERTCHLSPWSEPVMRESLQGRHRGFGLFERSQLVGFAITLDIVDECHLLNLCVDPAHQSRGFGRELLREIIARSIGRGCGFIYLEVRVSNRTAIHLYQSEGFNEVGIRPNYYPGKAGREDALLMTLDLRCDAFA
jgi:ribosomal-protein-alanine N-acetyltransferase